MLRMPPFTYRHARTWEEARDLWHAADGAMYVAGGTDLLPNLKHELFRPEVLVGLSGLEAGGVRQESDTLVVGANVTLDALSRHPLTPAPLAQAAGLVASPQIRRMGTIGGNVLLDTRCLFYNQSKFWRQALGHCLKAEGDWCHVIGGPKTCVAAQSSDCVPVLLALDASIVLLGPSGSRALKLRDLYRFNGMDHLKLDKGELLTEVRVPVVAGLRGQYRKLRMRGSIDFPQLGVAVTAVFDGDTPTALDIVVGAANPQPKPVRKLDAYVGQPLTDAAVDEIAALVVKQTRPNEAVQGDPQWRRGVAGIYAARSLRELRDQV